MATVRFRALDQLIKVAPQIGRRPPYWRPAPAPIDPTMLIEPAWGWRREPQPGDRVDDAVVILDAIGAYLASASSVEVAHDALTHTGARAPDRAAVGYWLVMLPPWQGHRLPPPWGDRQLPDGPLWITGPTMRNLLDLADAKQPACDRPEVLDSWLGGTPMRLRKWTDIVAAARADAIRAHDRVLYEAVKTGYSQAVTLMGTGEGTKVHRPDWGHAIRAQHAATFWWKCWRAEQAGYAPLGLAQVDELALTRHDATDIWTRQQNGLKVPLHIDLTGQKLGAFKPKATITAEEWARIASTDEKG